MAKMTSAYANKVIRKLQEDKEFWLNKERNGHVYVAAVGEEPVIPEYDYKEVAANIKEIDEKIIVLKHAINIANTTNEVVVNENAMTIDALLVRMAQLNRRKESLDTMRKLQPKKRVAFSASGSVPEYRYINYDLEQVKRDYNQIDAEIATMQLALDKFNQTFEFDVEV